MKKPITLLTILLAACAFAAAFAFTGASAEGDARDSELYLPSSYEQYLEMNEPSAFAMSDRYIAIVDKTGEQNSALYLYDKEANKYERRNFSGSKISSVRFYGNEILFFLSDLSINYIDCSNLSAQPTETGVSATSFIVYDGTIYFSQTNSDVTTIKKISVDRDLQIAGTETEIKRDNSNGLIPAFAVKDGTVYYTIGSDIYEIIENNSRPLLSTPEPITSFYIANASSRVIYYVSGGNNFYKIFNGESALLTAAETVSSNQRYVGVKEYGGYLYLIDVANKSIRRFDYAKDEFTPYEIGKYSSNPARLNKASDLSVYDDTLVISDTGNRRIKIAGKEQEHALELTYDPDLVCAGSENFAVTDRGNVYFYNYNGSLLAQQRDGIEGNILACTYAYGIYYFLTDAQNSVYAYDFGTQTLSKGAIDNVGAIGCIAADLYGNVYVNSNSGLFRYTVENFMHGTNEERLSSVNFGAGIKKLLVDFAGNLFGLSNDTIYKYSLSEKNTVVTPLELNNGHRYVFNQSNVSAQSFAFGLTDGKVYVLSEGFILAKDAGVETLNNIAAESLYEDIFTAAPSHENLIVDVPAGSVAVKLSLSDLTAETEILPYDSFEQLQNNRTGVVLGKISAGTVVDFYTYVPSQAPNVLPQSYHEIYLIAEGSRNKPAVQTYFNAQSRKGYISSEVGLYLRPVLQKYAESARLARESELSVLGKISVSDKKIDCDYFFVQTADGTYGFVPAPFVTEANVAELENEKFSYGTLKKGKSVLLISDDGERITLENGERVKVYDAEVKEGYRLVSFEQDGVIYYAQVEEDSLYKATKMPIVTLVIVLVVAAAVLFNACYLIFRRTPGI